MELLKRYQEQYEEFVKIDDFNLESRAKRVPAEKHFWAARLIEAKIEKHKLLKRKKLTRESTIKDLLKESKVALVLDKKTIEDIDNSDKMESIMESIQDQEMLIEFLELLMKNVSFIAQDIKNIILIKQLETQ